MQQIHKPHILTSNVSTLLPHHTNMCTVSLDLSNGLLITGDNGLHLVLTAATPTLNPTNAPSTRSPTATPSAATLTAAPTAMQDHIQQHPRFPNCNTINCNAHGRTDCRTVNCNAHGRIDCKTIYSNTHGFPNCNTINCNAQSRTYSVPNETADWTTI